MARHRRLFLIAMLMCWAVVSAAPSRPAGAERDAVTAGAAARSTLVIGKVSNDPRMHYHYLKPMVDYVAAHMKDLGITKGDVLMARDNAQMIDFLKRGKVDWVTETAFPALLYEHQKAAEILLRKWKKDAAEYYTVFFARRDGPIHSLSDLKGRVLALEDPGSTTAFFDPLMCLIENNLAVQRLDSFKQRPAPDKVGYVFSRQEINSSVWVHKGLVDAGAFNNQDWNKSDHMYKNMREGMKIIYRSDPIPRAFELVRTDLDPSIKERLKAILLKAHRDGNAQKALREYQSTRQFDEMDLNSIRALHALREALLDNLKVLR
jgi:phosphonate transport system substrate-binding protein